MKDLSSGKVLIFNIPGAEEPLIYVLSEMSDGYYGLNRSGDNEQIFRDLSLDKKKVSKDVLGYYIDFPFPKSKTPEDLLEITEFLIGETFYRGGKVTSRNSTKKDNLFTKKFAELSKYVDYMGELEVLIEKFQKKHQLTPTQTAMFLLDTVTESYAHIYPKDLSKALKDVSYNMQIFTDKVN